MKATGIVRHIDDLGRVVIPKELRRKRGIKEGDPVEFFIDDAGHILVRKYIAADDAQASVDDLLRLVQSIPSPTLRASITNHLNAIGNLLAGAR